MTARVLSRKPVFKADLFKVVETEIELSKGKRHKHFDVERSSVVCVLPLTDAYELYLVSQYRYLLQKNTLEAVGGFIGKKETSIQAAKRELKEETGIIAVQLEELARVELAPSVFKGIVHIFLAKNFEEGTQENEEDETITVVKMPLEEAVKKVMSGEINETVSMTGILLLDKLRGEEKL